jgi:hypothetical protein
MCCGSYVDTCLENGEEHRNVKIAEGSSENEEN